MWQGLSIPRALRRKPRAAGHFLRGGAAGCAPWACPPPGRPPWGPNGALWPRSTILTIPARAMTGPAILKTAAVNGSCGVRVIRPILKSGDSRSSARMPVVGRTDHSYFNER